MILLLWYLFANPGDRLLCTLWTTQATQKAFVAACGAQITADLALYRSRVISLDGGATCYAPANDLKGCQVDDRHKIEIYQENYTPLLCMVTVSHTGEPTSQEIKNACGQAALGLYVNRKAYWRGPYQKPAEVLPQPTCRLNPPAPGTGMYDQPDSAAALATSQDYLLLAGDLLWYGYAFANCGGASGIDTRAGAATTCGMESTRSATTAWQNQFDTAIYAAALKTSIPARALKAVIGLESQFWPLTVRTGMEHEFGMIQLTDDGADIALRYSVDLYQEFCPVAVFPALCPVRTYQTMSLDNQAAIRNVLRASMACIGCDPNRAVIRAVPDMLTYARILAAYRCWSLEISPGSGWEVTLAVYHSGGDCIQAGVVCQEGLDYVGRLKGRPK